MQSTGEPQQDSKRKARFGFLMFGMWLIAYGSFVAFLYVCTPLSNQTLTLLGADLPIITQRMLEIGSFVRSTPGLLAAAGVLVVSFLPFALGARGKTATKLYGMLFLVALLGVATVWIALVRPTSRVTRQLAVPEIEVNFEK